MSRVSFLDSLSHCIDARLSQMKIKTETNFPLFRMNESQTWQKAGYKHSDVYETLRENL